ncbi:hypothetical protein [Streptomyces sp. M92]|uniref:hypothetical protein n=1 Tax=Streptomyces sp. M92 TaxID=2944250 RepID=UPI002349D75C|nr:hypothetical protein [Streptomyces sp. M92]WCN06081.1 hypothetical protein M6G08_30570 [Streptomyces sp. M92]
MANTQTTPEVDPFTAVEALRTALDGADIVLPSLAVDVGSPSLALVDLGRVRADVALRLAAALAKETAA